MAHQQNGRRLCVLIVEEDLEWGIKLADWLASQRYQAVLVRSFQTAINELGDIRPEAVLVGLAQTESAFPINLQGLFRALETSCSRVPVITMGNRTSGALTHLLYGGVLRHLHVPIKPVEFTYIGRLLHSELNAATASPHSPRAESDPPDRWAVDNRFHARTTHYEAAPWMG
ncbi:MAG: hypothetical protein ABL950_08295 [Nitrospira sp.]